MTYANPAFPNPLGASYGSNVMPTTSNAFVPVVNDPGPFPGSNLDTSTVKPPFNFDENAANPTLNLTFATQPLSFMGQEHQDHHRDRPESHRGPSGRPGRHQNHCVPRPGGQLGLVSAGLQCQRCV